MKCTENGLQCNLWRRWSNSQRACVVSAWKGWLWTLLRDGALFPWPRPASTVLPVHPSSPLQCSSDFSSAGIIQPHSRDCSSITFPSKILRKTVNRWSFAPVSSSLLLPWSINYLQVERVCMKCYFSNQMPIVPYLVSSAMLLIFLRLWSHPEILWAGPILSRTILLESRKNKGCSKEGSFSSGRWALLALVQPRKMSPAKTPIQSKV